MIGSNRKTFETKPITREGKPFGRSAVNIIIPYHAHFEHVAQLVESILRITKSNPYQICLVDDASPNENQARMFGEDFTKLVPTIRGAIPQIIWTRNEKQLGFAASLKRGFEYTAKQRVVAPWVIFLHSDCKVVDPGWMIEMGQSLLRGKSSGIKMVSARSDNPGDGFHPSLGGEREGEIRKGNDVVLEEGCLPLYCAMCHRELFNHIGGFIKTYPYAMYEDEELGYRMRHYRYKQAISVKSWIHHEGNVTIGPLWSNLKIRKQMEDNRNRCISDIKSLS